MVWDDGFIRSEFACHCGSCGLDTLDAETLEVLIDIRNWSASSVLVLSGHRCYDWNEEIGGSTGSKHLEGRASDIHVAGKTPKEVADYLEEKYPHKYGIGRYHTFTHIDTREGMARWGNN